MGAVNYQEGNIKLMSEF